MRASALFVILGLLASACAGPDGRRAEALAPRASKPVPPQADVDPMPINDGDISIASVGGIQVIVKRVPGAEFAAAQLYIRGGVRNWTATNAGIEKLALSVAASGGTTSLDKNAFAQKLASIGAELRADLRNDFSALDMRVSRAGWDEGFALLADAFRHPLLPTAELDLARQGALSSLHHEIEDPDGRLWTLERTQVFAGHPYANRANGTIDTVAAISRDDIASHLQRLTEKRRLLFVAVGDVDIAHVVEQISHAFGDLPSGNYVETPIPPIVFTQSRVVFDSRKLPTNYTQSMFAMPSAADPDYVTGLVATSALSARINEEVRMKRGLSYSQGAAVYSAFARPLGSLNVTAVDTNAAMKVALDEVRRLQREPAPDVELAGYKSLFLTGYLEQRETTVGQATALAEAQLYAGDWKYTRTLPDRVRAVTAEDVRAFASKYMVRLQTALVGDPSKADQALLTSL